MAARRLADSILGLEEERQNRHEDQGAGQYPSHLGSLVASTAFARIATRPSMEIVSPIAAAQTRTMPTTYVPLVSADVRSPWKNTSSRAAHHTGSSREWAAELPTIPAKAATDEKKVQSAITIVINKPRRKLSLRTVLTDQAIWQERQGQTAP